jgi:hypothetical protein
MLAPDGSSHDPDDPVPRAHRRAERDPALEHWSNHLVADRYQLSDKAEYFAVRNAAGLFDTSPLYKYRITGRDAEAFLAGVLARDIRACPPGAPSTRAGSTTRVRRRGRRRPPPGKRTSTC